MPETVTCPSCGTLFLCKETQGREVSCPECRTLCLISLPYAELDEPTAPARAPTEIASARQEPEPRKWPDDTVRNRPDVERLARGEERFLPRREPKVRVRKQHGLVYAVVGGAVFLGLLLC